MITLHYVVGPDTFDVEVPGGGPLSDGELTLLATPEVWARLVDRSLDPAVAFMQGKVKVSGDMAAFYDLLPSIPLPA